MKILTMVEEGKVTAQEAAKLLEAVGQKKNTGEFSTRIVEKVVDGVSGIVGGAFSMALGEEKELKAEEGDELVIKSVGSSVRIDLHGSENFVMKPTGGLVKTKKEDGTISAKIVGGAAELLCPKTLSMTIKDAGGSVEGEGSATLAMKQLGGSCELSFEQISDVSIDSKGGSATVYLGDCDTSFDITASDGTIDFEVPADFEIQEDEHVKGKIKKGKGSLCIRLTSGNVRILPIEGKEKE
jgi:DUF4097 and DUF4098 domain-containing protein YvlB